MKKIIEISHLKILVSLALAFFFFVFSFNFFNLSTIIYPTIREALKIKVQYSTSYLNEKETKHFIFRYDDKNADEIDMIAKIAEESYDQVNSFLNYNVQNKILIIVHPDKESLKKGSGYSYQGTASGFYQNGTIQILAPDSILESEKAFDEYRKNGPILHEYTHYVLDYRLKGNYPRWFTEGVAQYLEYLYTGYEWIDENNKFLEESQIYTLEDLDKRFDNLSNQALAYRESLAIIKFIENYFGKESFEKILFNLSKGINFKKSIEKSLNIKYFSFEQQINLFLKDYFKN